MVAHLLARLGSSSLYYVVDDPGVLSIGGVYTVRGAEVDYPYYADILVDRLQRPVQVSVPARERDGLVEGFVRVDEFRVVGWGGLPGSLFPG